MSEGGDAVSDARAMLVSIAGVLQALTGTLLPGQVILLSVLLSGSSMGVRGKVVKLGCPPVTFVIRRVAWFGHNL